MNFSDVLEFVSLQIHYTVLIPYYNVMGIIENSNVKLDGLTIYQLHRKTNPNLN